MYLLYLDDSGNPDDASDRYFVLGGCALFERQTFYFRNALEGIQQAHFPEEPPVPFHASEIRSGTGFWRRVSEDTRDVVLEEISGAFANVRSPGLVLFAVAIRKNAECHGEEAVRLATEDICKRFDIFLMRRANEHDDKQRGLLVFSKGKYDRRSKLWVREFRSLGTKWGIIRNLSDIPYFADMRETRMLQAADYVAHSTFLLYERHDPSLIEPILSCFDRKDGVLHGLAHLGQDNGATCNCPACVSRREPYGVGPWVGTSPFTP
jgi:hypothetical protein